MGYRNLRECIDDLAAQGELIRLEDEVDPHLEAAEIHRRVNAAGGPAIFYGRVQGCQFPMVSNLFGTRQRADFIFRDRLDQVRRLISLKADPEQALQHPFKNLSALRTLWQMRPKGVSRGPALECTTSIGQLPQLQCWPRDGGAFITLPLVYTEDPRASGWNRSNLGMYRVQLSGGQYTPEQEIGMHYQIHRGIGVHHAAALERGEPLHVNIFVGGAPAMMLAAVMPLPEGLSELTFAGALGGRRVPLVAQAGGTAVYAEADFVIQGIIENGKLLPEGPFGDHLGYYSLAHDFPVLRVTRVSHRLGAIWPFTVVGRPPQEDSILGELIHDLTGPVLPTVIAGLVEVHAVDAAGVHPLLLAIGRERYTPYQKLRQPQEILTVASAILGQGQLSLAKYLWIAAHEDDPQLKLADIPRFFSHMLARVNWKRDLHFFTNTTIDTLDYSGVGINEGSKVIIAAAGAIRRELSTRLPHWPEVSGFRDPRLALPGVVMVTGPAFTAQPSLGEFCAALAASQQLSGVPLVVVVDDSEFTAANLRNFLWVTFTRSNPAKDIHGVGEFVRDKHWGCTGPLVIDARSKPHHAPPLEVDEKVRRQADRFFVSGGPLQRWDG
jgi:4-hydroxy-3-polyprenylbenzoate decarboxylase